MIEHWKATLRVLGVVVLISELLLTSEGSLCSARVERFYRRNRKAENNAALSMVFDWVSTAKGIRRITGKVQSTKDLYNMLDPSPTMSVDHLQYSNLVESINDISSALSMENTRRMSKLHPNRQLIVENVINQFWTVLNRDGHSMASRETFGHLVRLGHRYGVLGKLLDAEENISVLKTQQKLQAFFDSITSNVTLLSRVLGTVLPAQTFGLVISLHSSMSDELALLQRIAPNLVAAISSKVNSVIMLPLQHSMDDTPTEYSLQDDDDRQHFYNDINNLKVASNLTDHYMCTEQGFKAIRTVLAKSAPHSSILFISDTAPGSGSDERHQVLSAALAKDIQVHFVLAEGGCMRRAGEGFEPYKQLAGATGGTVLTSVWSVPSLFHFIMASRAKTPFVSIPANGSEITRIRVPALNDNRTSKYGDLHGLIPFVPTEETFLMLQESETCHEFLITALDADINVIAMATKHKQVVFLQEPGYTVYLRYFGPEVLNLSIHSPTPGRWKACSQKRFGLQIGYSQLFDFSLEYLRYHRRNGYKITRTPTGCGNRKVVFQSPRMHLIGDSCPLLVNMYHMNNGSLVHPVPLRKCDDKQSGFLQARLQLIPMPLVYRISGCDFHGNHFEKSLLTPFFTPRVAMVTILCGHFNDALSANRSAIVSCIVQNMELEPATISFKVQLTMDADIIVQKVPQTLDLGEGESGQVSFTFRPASNASNRNVTGLAMITPRLTTETGMKLRGCPVMQRIYQQHYAIGSELREGNCSKNCQHGFCTEDNICTCVFQYTGRHCETPVCTLPCQHKGQCVAPDTCKCPEAFTGDLCETPVCDPSCQNGGLCISPNTCECPRGYTGSACTTPICSKLCENSGACVAPDTCNCTVGYTGELCEVAVCDPPCQNGGICSRQHTCECGPHYTGSSCSSPICNHACLNGGTCTSPDMCSCANGYIGKTCSEAVCKEPCRNGGSCVAPSICDCADGYTGDICEVPICSTECKNGGMCVGKDECLCLLGYSGSHCETAICTSLCLNGGTCVEPDTCACPSNYTGSICSEPVCIVPCLNGGRCTAPGVCTCTTEFTGAMCEVPVCQEPCQNGGSCSAPNVCTCEDGYEGDNCGVPICTPPCLNDGACSNDRSCQCIQYYSGLQCEERLCSDYDHHVAYIGNLNSEQGNRRLVIFPSGNDPVEVTISGTLQLPSLTVQIPPDVPYIYIMSHSVSVTHHSQQHKGFFVHASGGKRVKVMVVNEESGSIGVVSSIPTAFPRDDAYQFYALSVDSTLIQGVGSAILLVGAYDNTTVTMTTPYTLTLGRFIQAGVPFSFMLDQGETYLIRHPQDLTGTYIESNKWLTVYSGHECAEVPTGRLKCDHLVDQVPPLSVWGQTYVVGALETQIIGYQLKVLAGGGPTMARVRCFNVTNGVIVRDSTYNISSASESAVIVIPEKQDCTIASNDKILVAQLAQGQGTSDSFFGDPFLTFVPSTAQYVPKTKFTTISTQDRIRAKNMKNYINLIVQQKWFDVENITLDGEKLSDLRTRNSTSRLVDFPLGKSYVVISMEVTHGLHYMEHASPNAEMAVLSYGFASHWSYGYWTNTEEAMTCDKLFMP